MIGNRYELKKASSIAVVSLLNFHGVPSNIGTVITVLKSEPASFGNYVGAVEIEVEGKAYTVNRDDAYAWSFFTECMTNSNKYDLWRVLPKAEWSSVEERIKKSLAEVYWWGVNTMIGRKFKILGNYSNWAKVINGESKLGISIGDTVEVLNVQVNINDSVGVTELKNHTTGKILGKQTFENAHCWCFFTKNMIHGGSEYSKDFQELL